MSKISVKLDIGDIYYLKMACNRYVNEYIEEMDNAIDQNDYNYMKDKCEEWKRRRAIFEKVIEKNIKENTK